MPRSDASLICPKCQCPLAEDAPRGLCSRCLVRSMLDSGPLPARPAALPRQFGAYVLLEELARGGMGIVYRARQQQVNRTVALKVLVAGQFAAPDFVERFRIEADATASLDHPNIVPVYEAGECEGQPFFSMKLIEGTSIAQRFASPEPPMAQREAADLLAKLARAVHYAHQRGILHRDLKPGNILLDAQGEPHLTDFGLAKLVDGASALTLTMAMLGTPAYMSPEQARGEARQLTTAVDVYGLGAVFYELLTGQPPFAGATAIETVRQVLDKDPRWPSTLRPGLSQDLETICLKCLNKDPARRYGSAEALAADLERWQRHEPILARPIAGMERALKWIQRNQAAFLALFTITVLLVAGVSVSSWLAMEATSARKDEVEQRKAAQDAQAYAEAQQKKAEAHQQRAELEQRRAAEQLMRTDWLVYAGKLMLAQTDFEAGDGGLAQHFLDECQPGLRGWEHRYLQNRIRAELTLAGHQSAVNSVAFSSNGQCIVTGSEDGTVKVWDSRTGRILHTLKGNNGPVSSVAYSSDCQRIVTGTADYGLGKALGGATVWDAVSGQMLLVLKGHNYSVWSVAFSSDGQRIITGAGDRDHKEGEAKVWDAVTGKEIPVLQDCAESLRGAVFSPDRQRIITASTGGLSKMWNAATGQPLFSLKGHRGPITSVAFSADGQQFVTGSWDCTAMVRETTTGRPLFIHKGHKEAVTCVAFSPVSQQIVTGSRDQTIKLWDPMKDEEVLTFKGHAGIVRGVSFSPDGKRIVTASEDRTAKVWDASRGQEVPTIAGHADFVSSLAFSPDSQRLVTGSGDGRAKVWDTMTGREILSINGSTPRSWKVAGVWSVAFSPDGQRILTGSQDKTAKIWNATNGKELMVLHHSSAVSSVAFSPDGKQIATGTGPWDNVVTSPGETKLWDAASGRELLALRHASGVLGVSFSPDGQRIASSTGDGTARVSDAATGRELLTLRHTNAVWSVAFSKDGRFIVTGSWDRTARVWDAATGREIFILRGHTGQVRGVAFSPDGQRIVTCSDDRTVKLWNAATGQEALTLPKHTEMVWSVAFSPDGQVLTSGIAGADATVKVWSTAPPAQRVVTEAMEKAAE